MSGEYVFELIPPRSGRRRARTRATPRPSPWDLFFDIEADPWATEVGLEYLLGVVEEIDGEPRYLDIWATISGRGEGRLRAIHPTSSSIVSTPTPRCTSTTTAAYESGAIKRLMQRHGTCVDEVDRLLRGDVLVDLLNVVRQGVRASLESYSLKQIEKFYMPAREGPVTEAGFSVVAFETWLKEGDQTILDGIAAYNRDDCISTWLLRGWLEDRRAEAVARWPELAWERPVAAVQAPSEALTAWLQAVEARVAGLTADLAVDDHSPEPEGRRLLARSPRLAPARGEVAVVALFRAEGSI